uniref:DUF977 family protein n=2 Tax=Escherichia coli TaxID=562 RepID=A0A6M9WQZ1_ECOLX|nr:DUF977 family protein [Escherichia coli]
MKNIATGGVLERIRRLAPPHVTAPFRTVAEWREWQLAEGQKRCEEINRQNRQLRVEKILNRSGIQPLHRKCSFSNYQVQNEGQRYALSQAKSIADELMTGCTNFAFSGKPGTGKNHLAAAIWSLPDGEIRRYDRRLNIICRECRKSEVMQRVLAFYQNGFRERLGDQG